MKVAVVGHVEWIRFARVERSPGPGEIAHAADDWERGRRGGGVAAIELAPLADEAHLYTALGDDELGRRSRAELEARGVHVHAAPGCPAAALGVRARRRGGGADDHDRRARSFARSGAMTRLPWHRPCRDGRGALHRGRCRGSSVRSPCARVDRDCPGSRHPPPRRRRPRRAHRQRRGRGRALSRRRARSGAGSRRDHLGCARRLDAARRPVHRCGRARARARIAYGCGDSFMAGLTFALGAELEPHDAVAFAARCGAAALTGRAGAAVRRPLIAARGAPRAPVLHGLRDMSVSPRERFRASLGRRRHAPGGDRRLGDGGRGGHRVASRRPRCGPCDGEPRARLPGAAARPVERRPQPRAASTFGSRRRASRCTSWPDDQEQLAWQFARKGAGKFDGLDVTRGLVGAPIFGGAACHDRMPDARPARRRRPRHPRRPRRRRDGDRVDRRS